MSIPKAATAILFLCISAKCVRAQQSLFGLTLGMKRHDALHLLHKPGNALKSIPFHSGRQILTDTIPLTFCKIPYRRSVGFDTTGKLTAVGLTYETTPDQIQKAHDCALEWLTNTLGPATREDTEDSVTHDIWILGPAKLTLEAKGYNSHDFFVLIYYYSAKEALP
jgi:hypothetical protein